MLWLLQCIIPLGQLKVTQNVCLSGGGSNDGGSGGGGGGGGALSPYTLMSARGKQLRLRALTTLILRERCRQDQDFVSNYDTNFC